MNASHHYITYYHIVKCMTIQEEKRISLFNSVNPLSCIPATNVPDMCECRGSVLPPVATPAIRFQPIRFTVKPYNCSSSLTICIHGREQFLLPWATSTARRPTGQSRATLAHPPSTAGFDSSRVSLVVVASCLCNTKTALGS